KFIDESVSEHKTTHFDWWGAITLGVALSTLVLVLDQGLDWGWWSLNSVLCYVITLIFSVLFVRIEHYSEEPIVDLKFFKIPAFVNTLWNNFIVFMGMMGSVFLLPIFAQTFLGYSATQSGYLFIPMAVGLMAAAPIGGSLVGRVKPNYVIAASTFVAGLGILAFYKTLDPRATAWDLMWPLMVMSFGLGFGMAQRTNIIASVVDQHEIGIASSVLALARNIAGAFGIAVFATLLNNFINHNVMSLAQNSVLNSQRPGDLQKFIGLIVLKAQVMGYAQVFLWSAVLVLVGAVTALWIRVDRERTDVHIMVE
ncbi:MAG: MFS transporter, partial [Patescibacteria group bacterium]|nr:MFS transporter [Patescibacteria group bacterium]